MANGILPVDFRDDILSEDMNNRRRYQMITNSDGTVSFEDVTKYDQVGSNFGQAQVNATNKAVNGLADSIGDAFSEEKTYAAGEYAIYDNALYEFTAAKAAGPWDPDVAALTTIADALSELNGNMSSKSHIGMIIHSTALDTMEKVIAVYGGTEWQRIEGRFLLGSSDDYEINSTGGEATHKLTVKEMPSHAHNYNQYGTASNVAYNSNGSLHVDGNIVQSTYATGGSMAHNNMPPYKSVYIWERTA